MTLSYLEADFIAGGGRVSRHYVGSGDRGGVDGGVVCHDQPPPPANNTIISMDELRNKPTKSKIPYQKLLAS